MIQVRRLGLCIITRYTEEHIEGFELPSHKKEALHFAALSRSVACCNMKLLRAACSKVSSSIAPVCLPKLKLCQWGIPEKARCCDVYLL